MSTSTHPAPGGPSHWLDERKSPVTDLGRLLVGLIIVSLGTLFLLDAAGTLDSGEVIGNWWPSVVIAAGVLTLLERPPALVRGSVITGIGVVALLFTTDVLADSAWDYVWPAAIILAGVAVIAHWSGRRIPAGVRPEDVLRTTSVFGGAKLAPTNQRFRGAWLTAVFGGIELDLRGALPVPEGASVNTTTAFGGAEILVPKGWKLSIRSTPIFGGVEDKTDKSAVVAEDAPLLNIDAVCIFGGVEIKHEK